MSAGISRQIAGKPQACGEEWQRIEPEDQERSQEQTVQWSGESRRPRWGLGRIRMAQLEPDDEQRSQDEASLEHRRSGVRVQPRELDAPECQ
ncbi:MAG: hypothetical protein QM784_36620 [Polyangiaceae bacterium]